MSRRYRKSRRDPGLIEIAATSDWKVSAAMAAVCVLAATVIIPALFGSSRVLGSLVLIFVPLAWLITVVFGGISLVRFLRQRPQDSPAPPRSPTNRPAQAAARATARVRQLRSQVLVFARSHFQKCHYNSVSCSGAAGFSIPKA